MKLLVRSRAVPATLGLVMAACSAAPFDETNVTEAEYRTGSCAAANTCAACADTLGCGWCDGRCVEGDSDGPDTGTCSSYAYVEIECSGRRPPESPPESPRQPSTCDWSSFHWRRSGARDACADNGSYPAERRLCCSAPNVSAAERRSKCIATDRPCDTLPDHSFRLRVQQTDWHWVVGAVCCRR